MSEVLFYHLEYRPLVQVLPLLLEKTLARGWRAVVEVGSDERAQMLDEALWTFRDESFLPHGLEGSDFDNLQPIILSTGPGNPNNAEVRFFVERAVPRMADDYQRLVYMFSGHDPEAVNEARVAWKALSLEHQTTYWQQGADGHWAKKG